MHNSFPVHIMFIIWTTYLMQFLTYSKYFRNIFQIMTVTYKYWDIFHVANVATQLTLASLNLEILGVQWITWFLRETHICDSKENSSKMYLNLVSKKLLLTSVSWNKRVHFDPPKIRIGASEEWQELWKSLHTLAIKIAYSEKMATIWREKY
jgi:hypothetical protein